MPLPVEAPARKRIDSVTKRHIAHASGKAAEVAERFGCSKSTVYRAKVDGPAIVRPEHIRDRILSAVAGTPNGYRVVTWPIQIAYEHGKLAARSGGHDANTRWLAIREYDEIHELALCRSGRDSTDMDVVSGGSGFPITDAMGEAIKKLISIDSHMASKDRQIVRKLCEGETLAEAVRQACGDSFTHTVPARVRDALDALYEALDAARANGYRYVRMGGT